MSNSVFFNKDNYKKVSNIISRSGCDAVITNNEYSIKYLTGFYVSGTSLLALKNGSLVYFISSMNAALVKDNITGKRVEVVPVAGEIAGIYRAYFKEYKIKKVGIDAGNISLAGYKSLVGRFPKIKFITNAARLSIGEMLASFREVKSPGEIKVIKKAAQEMVKIWKAVKRKITPGMTEDQIRILIDTEVIKRGFENSFETIAATGKNSAHPHAISGNRKLGRNDHLLVDFGIREKGYCSDLTRTLYTGRIDRQILEFKKIVEEVQDFAINWIAPGKKIRALYEGVNSIFNDYKVEAFVLHGLGHGVGLEIHEAPHFGRLSETKFKKGMVVTVEPGLYKKGLGGVRIEDMVLVTKNGCEVLTI